MFTPVNPNEDCAICLDSKSNPRILYCGHIFCANCIAPCQLGRNPQCPTCRRKIVITRPWNAIDPLVITIDSSSDEENVCPSSLPVEPRSLPVEQSTRNQMIVGHTSNTPRTLRNIESHRGRGINIRYLCRWSDDTTSEEPRSVCVQYPSVWNEYFHRIRAANQRNYEMRRRNQ